MLVAYTAASFKWFWYGAKYIIRTIMRVILLSMDYMVLLGLRRHTAWANAICTR